jgi:hypothetical protein
MEHILVIPEMSRNGGDWRGLNPPQVCDGIIPPQSRSIRVGLGINEQAIRKEGLDRDKRPTLGRKSVAPYGLQKRK